MTRIGRIDHVQLAMPPGGEGQARAFYGELLGLKEIPKPLPLASRGGVWFQSDGFQVHIGVEADFRPSEKAHIAFEVDDVGSLAARAKDADYRVREDMELSEVERVFIYDPFGNRLEFLRQR